MLPLSLLRSSINHPLLVELKSGETYNGHLKNCDNWMNIHLCEVICTSKDGDKFVKISECYIRGCNIKYLILLDEVLNRVREEAKADTKNKYCQPIKKNEGKKVAKNSFK